MKLVEILAVDLNEWPEGAKSLAQDDTALVASYDDDRVPVYKAGIWNNGADTYCSKHDLASDHATAIINREMWEAERARLNQKANNEGWIRHRGGNRPKQIKDNDAIDVRYRNGYIEQGLGEEPYRWFHDGDETDIMAYRIHKPEQADLPSESMKPAPGMISFGPLILGYKGVDAIPSSLKDQQVGRAYRENPLQWRDRILELTREQATADLDHKAATEARDAEKAELMGRLKAEGLALISEVIESQEDMSDPVNWRVGDLLRKTKGDGLSSEGYIATITKVEENRITATDECGGDSWSSFTEIITDHEWHSRPSN